MGQEQSTEETQEVPIGTWKSSIAATLPTSKRSARAAKPGDLAQSKRTGAHTSIERTRMRIMVAVVRVQMLHPTRTVYVGEGHEEGQEFSDPDHV